MFDINTIINGIKNALTATFTDVNGNLKVSSEGLVAIIGGIGALGFLPGLNSVFSFAESTTPPQLPSPAK